MVMLNELPLRSGRELLMITRSGICCRDQGCNIRDV
jgi:hypothetical protein